MDETKLLNLVNIKKSFAGVHALTGVDFDLNEGEVHALCGENGAGKSTLVKILAGNYDPTSGEIFVEGKHVAIKNPLMAEQLGIAIVYQELSLSETVTVAENMFMGREPLNKLGLIKRKELHEQTQRYLDMVKCPVKPDMLTKLLTVAEMQMVQIAKALSVNAKILILDEPCSSISEDDSERLFAILRELKTRGIGIIYIDHRLDNIFKVGDRVTVLRDGAKVGTRIVAQTSKDELVQMMVDRPISNVYPKESKPQNEVRLKVTGLKNRKIKGFEIELHKGEILGLGGLVGAGRSEIVRALFGIDKCEKGKLVEIDGEPVYIKNTVDAINAGFGYIPEDRKLEGLCLYRSITFNTVIVYLKSLVKGLLINDKEALKKTNEMIKRLNIKVNDPSDNVDQLSGGNQQKVVVAKWLMMNNMKILLMDEPTRGIDVGAKYEIYKLISNLAKQGIAIIVVTSELPELLGICDRIVVINQGKISGILERNEFSQEAVMRLCV